MLLCCEYCQHAKNVLMQNISDFASSISNSLFSWWQSEKGVQRPDGVSVLDSNAAAAAAAALSSRDRTVGRTKLMKTRYRRPASTDQEGGDGKGKDSAGKSFGFGERDGEGDASSLQRSTQAGGPEQLRAAVPSDRTASSKLQPC